jgi:hypothetical protein
MTEQVAAQASENKNNAKGTYLFTQPLTDGTISPVIKISLNQNLPNNNKLLRSHKLIQKSRISLVLTDPKKNLEKDSTTLSLSTLRKNSEETLPTSKQLKEVSRLKSLNKRSSSSTQLEILMALQKTQVMKRMSSLK